MCAHVTSTDFRGSPGFQLGATHTVDHAATAILDALGELRAAQQAILDRLDSRIKANYTVEEVAALTGRSPYTVRRWLKEEKIAAIRVCGTGPRGRLLIPREEFQKLILSGKGTHIPNLLTQEAGN
jgi:excisionase family DNA binding protein